MTACEECDDWWKFQTGIHGRCTNPKSVIFKEITVTRTRCPIKKKEE
jgi:hypothetical protein